jgi:hypothetical protein
MSCGGSENTACRSWSWQRMHASRKLGRGAQRGPDGGLASALGQAGAVWAVGEYVHGVRDSAGRERRGKSVGVLGGNVRVFRGVPDEERR